MSGTENERLVIHTSGKITRKDVTNGLLVRNNGAYVGLDGSSDGLYQLKRENGQFQLETVSATGESVKPRDLAAGESGQTLDITKPSVIWAVDNNYFKSCDMPSQGGTYAYHISMVDGKPVFDRLQYVTSTIKSDFGIDNYGIPAYINGSPSKIELPSTAGEYNLTVSNEGTPTFVQSNIHQGAQWLLGHMTGTDSYAVPTGETTLNIASELNLTIPTDVTGACPGGSRYVYKLELSIPIQITDTAYYDSNVLPQALSITGSDVNVNIFYTMPYYFTNPMENLLRANIVVYFSRPYQETFSDLSFLQVDGLTDRVMVLDRSQIRGTLEQVNIYHV